MEALKEACINGDLDLFTLLVKKEGGLFLNFSHVYEGGKFILHYAAIGGIFLYSNYLLCIVLLLLLLLFIIIILLF